VDTQGLLHAIAITTAYIIDRAGVLWLSLTIDTACWQSDECAGRWRGCTGHLPTADAVQNVLGAMVEVARRNELYTFAVTSKRWVVE